MRETKQLEFKETTNTNSFLKTVSAFANENGGTILFGVDDDGNICGITAPERAALDLENKINDSIQPRPDYTIDILPDNTIRLTVQAGPFKPYLYKNKAYKRSNAATVPVDQLEYNRLVLAGSHRSFEELPASDQNLSFHTLSAALTERIQLSAFTMDILKTLELYSDSIGFNNAAALLADQNTFPGIDIVRFGDSINEIMERRTIAGVSLLTQLNEGLNIFRTYYQYERIDGATREQHDKIPEEAFREALANALVHRTWDVPAAIRVSMHPDRITVHSPGGLPPGISETEYLRGQLSILRNPIIASAFFRLHYIEKFGTGILRIMNAYRDTFIKPTFTVSENAISVTLPICDIANTALTSDETHILNLLSKHGTMNRAAIDTSTGFDKAKSLRLLNSLLAKQLIKKSGKGPATTYPLP